MTSGGVIDISVKADTSSAKSSVKDLKTQVNEADSEAKSSGEGAFSKLGSAASTVASTVTKTLGAAITGIGTAITAVGTSAVQDYAEYEQLVGGVETLFGDAADTVMEYASNAYNQAGVSANDYMEQVTSFAASLVSSLGGDTAEAAEYGNMAVEDMSDNANKMGTSLTSIQYAYQGFAKQNYTMLDNLKLGYGGTQEEMERLIEDANELKEEQGEVGDLTIDSFADVVEAIHLVQENMGITGTTSEEAAETIEGSVNTMKAAWENWLTGLGDSEADMGELTDNLIESVENVGTNLAPVIAQVAGSLAGSLQDTLTGAFNAIAPAVSEAVSGVWNNIAAVIEGYTGLSLPTIDSSELESGIDGALTVVTDGVDAIGDSLGEFGSDLETSGITGDAFDALTEVVETLRTTFESLGDDIGPVIESITDTIGGLMAAITPEIIDTLSTAISTAGGVLQDIGATLSPIITDVMEFVQGIIPVIAPAINSVFTTAQSVLIQFGTAFSNSMSQIGTLWNTFWPTISAVLTVVFAGLSTIVQAAMGVIRGVITTITGLISGDWSLVWEGIKTVFSSIWTAIKTVVSTVFNAVLKVIKTILKSIVSFWSNKWKAIKTTLSNVWNKIKSTVSSALGKVKSTISSGLSTIKSKWSDAWDNVKTKFSNIWTNIKQGASDGVSNVVDKVGGVKTKILNKFKNAGKLLYNKGLQILNGLGNGIKDAVSGVLKKVTNATNSVINTVCDLLGINSPSRVMMEIGGYMMEGLAEGIADEAQQAIDSASAVVSDMTGTFSTLGVAVNPDVNYVVQAAGGTTTAASGKIINQNFEVKVVRAEDDIYTAVPTIVRSAVRSV